MAPSFLSPVRAAALNAAHELVDDPGPELPRDPDGDHPFEALGGYPTRAQPEAAMADALARRSHGFALDPAKLTVNQ